MSDAADPTTHTEHSSRSVSWVRSGLLLVWAIVGFGISFFARDLNGVVAGWPFSFWMAAQGGVLVFIGIVMVYAWYMNRVEQVDGAGVSAGVGGRAVQDVQQP